jgi:gentisate 1,2-dioxygenase
LEQIRICTEKKEDVTALEDQLIENTCIYEYMSASNPTLPKIPVLVHSYKLYQDGPSRIIPFDVSKELNILYNCTSPNLLASFIRIIENDTLECKSCATSNAFYIIKGSGVFFIPNYGVINYNEGDMIVVPEIYNSFSKIVITSKKSDTAIYWINDEPLLKYLNVVPNFRNFEPTLFRKEIMLEKIEEISHHENVEHKNRLGILLGNKKTDYLENGGSGTLTLTPTMWSLLNVLPKNSFQKPHRHNSVALDLSVSGGCKDVYTLMGPELDETGTKVKNPTRVNWEDGSVFITPPGWWHSHHNDSDTDAYVLPIQDAGLYTYQRTLNIEFS